MDTKKSYISDHNLKKSERNIDVVLILAAAIFTTLYKIGCMATKEDTWYCIIYLVKFLIHTVLTVIQYSINSWNVGEKLTPYKTRLVVSSCQLFLP